MIAATWALGAGLLTVAGPRADAATAEVRPEIVSSGEMIGVRFAIPRGKHVYWTNPGDAGLPTRIEFGLPKGFHAGPLQWAMPERFRQPGDITGYGYADDLLVWARIEGPADGPPAGEKVWATVSWLECDRRECVPGRADLEVAWAPHDVQGTFTDWKRRLPEHAGSAKPAGAPGRWEISIPWKGRSGSVRWVASSDPRVAVSDVVPQGGDPMKILCTVAPVPGGRLPPGGVDVVVAYKSFWTGTKGIVVRVPAGEPR